MDMKVPLPKPSFEIDTTVVRIHFLNWDSEKNTSEDVQLSVSGVFQNYADHYNGHINNEGHAVIRFFQYGTIRASLKVGNKFSNKFYPKSVIRDSFLLFLMTAIRKFQSYLSDCQQFTIFTTQKKSYSYDA